MGLSKIQQTALEKIRQVRFQSQPRTSEEAYGQMRRMVAAQKSKGAARPIRSVFTLERVSEILRSC